MNQSARLEDWVLAKSSSATVLIGRVYGHPRLEDGHWCMTSMVRSFSDTQATTLNTVYALGERGARALVPAHVLFNLTDRGYDVVD